MDVTTAPDGPAPAYLPPRASWADPFWRALANGRLLLLRCEPCGSTDYPPVDERCPVCGFAGTWVNAAGRGRLWSWTTMHRAYVPDYPLSPPYTVVMIELPEGINMLATLAVDVEPAGLRCDDPMRFEALELAPGVFVPGWRPGS